MIDDGAVLKQSAWFAVFGVVVALSANAATDIASRPTSSFSVFDGGTSFVSRYYGNEWAMPVAASVVGAVLGLGVGALLYAAGVRAAADTSNRVGLVVFAGTAGVALGLAPTLTWMWSIASNLGVNESVAVGGSTILVLYGFSAALAYGAALVAIWIALRARADERLGRTVRCAAVALPIGGVVATAAGVGTAWLYNFTTRVSTTIPVVLAVLLVLAATFALSRVWARRVAAT